MPKEDISLIPTEMILNKIFLLREEKVMLDFQLAEFYNIENRALKQAVRRNLDLFPDDFMFILSEIEVEIMVSQNVIPSRQSLGGANPFAFTETGVAMLSSILKSKKAREINISIMRAFVALRKMVLSNAELRLEVEKIKKEVDNQDKNIEVIFRYFDELLEQKAEPRKQIGYKVSKEK
ncbi:DNA-binding protein [Pedobacter sp. Leaf216]|uniref:ORF6N domain-containing protein n=1 Tax=Pedobacter sp. Leaf216 TaxID=1735684 RepID=UPI0006FA61BC|nr:ORF6N domain-containing protein [Pedobacter sp. Leaf216]KQM74944.1 DNA-binding protein [Pedobacter sp. Leaf216]